MNRKGLNPLRGLSAVVAAYMVLIFYLSVIRLPSFLPEMELANMDKFEHFVAYGILGFLWALDLRKTLCAGKTAMRVIGITFIITFGFGALIEICQSFIPYRSASILDAVANGAGGLTGAFVSEKLFNKKAKTHDA